MSGPSVDRCRSAGGARHVLAELLRRLVGRLEPAPPEPPQDLVLISRAKLREVQTMGLRMIDDYAWLSRNRGASEGFVWFPIEVLKSIEWLVAVELETRDRDFELVERDPAVVLR